MGLGIKEDLGMAHIVRSGTLEIGHGQIVEISAGQKHAGPGIIDVQKILKIGKVIGRPHRLDRGKG